MKSKALTIKKYEEELLKKDNIDKALVELKNKQLELDRKLRKLVLIKSGE